MFYKVAKIYLTSGASSHLLHRLHPHEIKAQIGCAWRSFHILVKDLRLSNKELKCSEVKEIYTLILFSAVLGVFESPSAQHTIFFIRTVFLAVPDISTFKAKVHKYYFFLSPPYAQFTASTFIYGTCAERLGKWEE